MMKSPVMRIVGMTAWLLTALAAIGVGLTAFGYNVYGMPWMQKIVLPANYILLAAGIISLLMFFMALSGGCGCCGTASHK